MRPGRSPRRRRRAPGVPYEHDEQVKLVQWLRWHKVLFCASLNGVPLPVSVARKARAAGMESGCPDITIYTPPPARPDKRGTAIELKRTRGGRTSDEQERWLRELADIGWEAHVAHGADDAIRILTWLGY